MADDALWPRASEWLAGRHNAEVRGRVAVLGAPLRLGSITPGRCDLAPAAIRAALHRYSTYDFDSAVDVLDVSATDLGDLPFADARPENAAEPLARAVRETLNDHDATLLLGGDNSITRGGVHGLGECGLLTIDAHLDLRSLDGGLSNGNPVRALLADGLSGTRIVQLGIQSFANSPAYARVARDAGIRILSANAVRDLGIARAIGESLAHLSSCAASIYVDLDLDAMDAVFAPGTPGARAGGLTPADMRAAAYLCGAHPKVRVLDLVELDPEKDVGGVTAAAAAACMLSFAAGVACRH